jgi:hypothetical protein
MLTSERKCGAQCARGSKPERSKIQTISESSSLDPPTASTFETKSSLSEKRTCAVGAYRRRIGQTHSR